MDRTLKYSELIEMKERISEGNLCIDNKTTRKSKHNIAKQEERLSIALRESMNVSTLFSGFLSFKFFFSFVFLLSSIYIRRKYWIRENFRLPVFDGFTCFEMS